MIINDLTKEDDLMPMPSLKIIDNLDFDHMDFSEACALVDTLHAALEAMAAFGTAIDLLDRLAVLHGRAHRRKHEAFDEMERERAEDAKGG
jgi:UDP-N-acetylmuramate-alanine ligase